MNKPVRQQHGRKCICKACRNRGSKDKWRKFLRRKQRERQAASE